jgi:hypothetical protein
MKYIIEGGIDFYNELNNSGNINNIISLNSPDENICLISKEGLNDNFITLPCKHTFNYIPLYKEVILQKILPNSLETSRLSPHQIRCPYCRLIVNNLLPYIPLNNVEKITNVNYPSNKCMKHLDCEQKLKNGNFCSKSAYKINGKIYCEQHWKIINEKKENKQKNETKDIEWSEEMEKYSKDKTVIDLKQILRGKGLKVGGTKKELVSRIINNK